MVSNIDVTKYEEQQTHFCLYNEWGEVREAILRKDWWETGEGCPR